MKYSLLFLIISLSCIQCKTADKEINNNKNLQSVKYAKGFDIISENGKKVVVVKKAFQNSNKEYKYVFTNKTNVAKNELKIPIKNIVVTSTTHIPMLELLGVENNLIGFPNTKYISSNKTRTLIDNEHIQELGSEQDMNTEMLIELAPELVVGFSVQSNNRVYENIKKAGIPVIFNGDWLEETPLGRAEWIKFFGALFNKEKEADSIFNQIEKNYLEAKLIAEKSTHSPTVLSGILFKDVWNVPAGESFMAKFFKDANLNYLWKETKGTGSLQFNIENILERAHNAEYWIGCGLFDSKKDLIATNQHYKKFNALNKNKVYTIAAKKGATGGLIYFELAPVRPDLFLKDLIKITNANLLPDYVPYFLETLKD